MGGPGISDLRGHRARMHGTTAPHRSLLIVGGILQGAHLMIAARSLSHSGVLSLSLDGGSIPPFCGPIPSDPALRARHALRIAFKRPVLAARQIKQLRVSKDAGATPWHLHSL